MGVMTTEQDAYRNAQPAKPRQPRQHQGHLTVRYRWVKATDGLERVSTAYSILLRGSSGSSSKQPEAINKDEDVDIMGGQGKEELGTQSASQ